ncbi:FixH family protein [Sphingobacterium paramultivorum]|uniref:FixH family protein n=1 Tax=Sphingobacterium paramultivorum TaxID=2886510 RepID=A0A7G5DXI8_9SPHI|nr:FixH family protein [Sphingobacterium paramultivorum]QMV66463.1 FixH family protein [Sphingobacterium paramultivorum]WSO15267.1 FixH family protein [Sphingobacterium paramultivorum]
MNLYSRVRTVGGVILLLLAFSVAFSTSSCTADHSKKNGKNATDFILPKESDLVRVADTVWDFTNYTIYADAKLNNKYHTIYLRLRDTSGNPINDKSLDFYPEMSMGRMKHGGPFEHPVALGEGWYRGPMVFIMADIPQMGKGWQLHTIRSHNRIKDTVAIKIPVTAAATMRTMSSGTRDDSRIFISCLLPDSVKQGKHPIRFLMNKMDGHHFPVLDHYVIKLKTNRPTTETGSSENFAAESTGNGYYEGTVNFSMPGRWEVIVELWKEGKKSNQDDIKYLVQVT